jgi:hypothetical protein
MADFMGPLGHTTLEISPWLASMYEGESKIIHNVDTCCAVGYTTGWAWCDTYGLLVYYCCGADMTLVVD